MTTSTTMGSAVTRQRELLLALDHATVIDVRIDEPNHAVRAPANATCIVLLPSSQRDSLDLDAFSALLAAAGHRVLRPQPRGMARSRGPMHPLNLNVLANDVAQVIQHCGNGRAIVAGHAFGHFVARVTALNHPALVRGVVVLAGAARVFPPGLTAALDTAADIEQDRTQRLTALKHAFFAPGNDPEPWLHGWQPRWREAYRQAASTPTKAQWWPVSPVPLLEVQGECDPWRPAATRDELRAVLGDTVTLRVIAHASHALLPEQPAAVAHAMLEWSQSLPD